MKQHILDNKKVTDFLSVLSLAFQDISNIKLLTNQKNFNFSLKIGDLCSYLSHEYTYRGYSLKGLALFGDSQMKQVWLGNCDYYTPFEKVITESIVGNETERFHTVLLVYEVYGEGNKLFEFARISSPAQRKISCIIQEKKAEREQRAKISKELYEQGVRR